METQGETKTATRDAPQATGQPSNGKDGSTSQTPKTYTETEKQQAVSDALAKAGREHKASIAPILEERDKYKSLVGQIEDKNAEIEEIQSQLESLSKDNPDAKEYLKLSKELRGLKSELKTERDALEREKKTNSEQWAERIAKAEASELAGNTLLIASEFKDGDPAKLLRLCQKAKVTSEDDIREMAETLWTKAAVPEAAANLHVDSGVTSGGSKGQTPSLDELRASSPLETERKIKSGEWKLPGWMA